MYKNLKHTTVLFLEDNITFAQHTVKFLELFVKEVVHCISIKSALKLFSELDIGVIISDLKVEDGIALEFIEQIRQMDKKIPIVVLSAHKDEDFLLKAIPLGLITYEIKPIEIERFKSILQKCESQLKELNQHIFQLKDNIFYNSKKKVIIKNHKEIILREKEAIFIELLLENKDSIVSKEEISQRIWQNEQMSESALKNFLLRIRKSVGKDLFFNVQGLGWRL
ncbi:MAG: response regulator transcription factor [Arcobacteraceae bacterium]|nr:response regulator transcription factor [Arcobacteraceae bacterium]